MPDDFNIPAHQRPDEKKVIDTQIREMLEPREITGTEGRYAVPPQVVRSVANIATNIWKAKVKMLDAASGEVREEMKRVYRHIEAALESMHEMDVEVKDHTGDAFDYGLPLKVITAQPTRGITKESIIETIKPTIYWQQHLIQIGEVVIATPSAPTPIA
jgi:hypothetical protein